MRGTRARETELEGAASSGLPASVCLDKSKEKQRACGGKDPACSCLAGQATGTELGFTPSSVGQFCAHSMYY